MMKMLQSQIKPKSKKLLLSGSYVAYREGPIGTYLIPQLIN